MSYPPQNPQQNFGPQGGPQQQYHPQGGYQGGPQQGGYQGGPQQGYGPQGGSPQGYGPQPGGFGPQGGYGAAPMGPAKKSNAWIWWLVGVLAVVVITVVILFATGVFGGGKYVGDKTPKLPDKFGNWSKVEGLSGSGDGEMYERGSDKVIAARVMGDPDEKLEDARKEAKNESGIEDFKERDLSKGIKCFEASAGGETGHVCTVMYKDGMVSMVSEKRNVAEEAAKDFAEHAE